MSTHKDIIKQYLDGVDRGDAEAVLPLVTDDVLMEKKGQPALRGKETLRAVIDNKDGAASVVHKDVGEQPRPTHKVERMIEEGDTVAVSGTVLVPLPNGQLEMLFSDYITFRGDLISSLESYMIAPAGPQG
ncbi:nuclear transport factor 2 family protein [Streptomyces synnematoformans]|uniref:Nuclear transport factor 2 family protein n=1 Tax=Streptomyces synnematoformans TaxID=415721 RepID=A0ABN2Z9U9_9ACTN